VAAAVPDAGKTAEVGNVAVTGKKAGVGNADVWTSAVWAVGMVVEITEAAPNMPAKSRMRIDFLFATTASTPGRIADDMRGIDRSLFLLPAATEITPGLGLCSPLFCVRKPPMIVINDEATPCGCCGKLPAVIYCDGCQAPLCVSCRTFDLWGYGCGHVDSKAFCPRCLRDPAVNPYNGFPDK